MTDGSYWKWINLVVGILNIACYFYLDFGLINLYVGIAAISISVFVFSFEAYQRRKHVEGVKKI